MTTFQDDESEETSSEEDDDEDETTVDESEAAETSDAGQFRGGVNGQPIMNIKDGLNYRSNQAFKTDDETDTEKVGGVRNTDVEDPAGVIVFSGNDSDGPGKAAEFLIAQTKQKFLGKTTNNF